jgi:hypothetical protein
MAFTVAELGNIANAALDFYIKGQPLAQNIQEKPLLAAMRSAQKTFPGGKDYIKGNVKGDYTTSFMGYEHDDTVTYANPGQIKQFSFPWKEHHAGIQVTYSELKKDGISVTEEGSAEGGTSNHSDREMTAISNLFEDKIEDMDEGMARSLNLIYWRDGTQDPKVLAGILSIITQTPASGITGGIDRATNRWWRNRARVGSLSAESGYSSIESITGSKITASAANQTLTKTLRSELRQLRRYGGGKAKVLCGSYFLDKLELEVFEKGTYTQTGFINNGKNDIGMADISLRGLGTFEYDPTLDDMGMSKFCIIIDTKNIYPMVMDGEDMKKHSPERPPEKYVLYRGVTFTAGLIARKLNSSGIYEVA